VTSVKRFLRIGAAVVMVAAVLQVPAGAADPVRRAATVDAFAIPANGAPVIVDGAFTEASWSQAVPVSDFVQREPSEGAAPTHTTDVRVLFDGAALYVAVKASDVESHRVVGLLTRRDESSPSDRISVIIDSFLDKRTAYEFTVNAAGVKSDFYWYNDSNNDRSWDAVWDAAVSRSPTGWQAEFKIPFSQLRFRGQDVGTLGFAVVRNIPHANEVSTWPLLARSAPGYVSSFGELRGVTRSGVQKKLELTPFVVGQMVTKPVNQSNPLQHSPDPGSSLGVDMKYQVAPGLTLSGTINPDFGQVEADPAVVNLGAFETFFNEQRPFFVEGSGNFQMGDLFYSRRIGRAPQRFASAPEGGFSAQPANTTILGAAKLTGKVGNYAVGVLHAVTSSESAEIVADPLSSITRSPVEPTTNYSVARLSREFSDNSRLSFVMTNMKRELTPELSFLPKHAVAGGVDAEWRMGKDYSLGGFWFNSLVRGSTESITRLQRSNVHSYQRPDSAALELDESRRSLTGNSGIVSLNKIGGTRTRGNVNVGYRSPGYDPNDLGFRNRSDVVWNEAWFQIRDDDPGKYVLRRNINFNHWHTWNFDGDRLDLGGNINSHWTFANNISIGGGVNVNADRFDDRRTRGGPGGRVPRNANGWWYVDTDNRRLVTLNLSGDWYRDPYNSANWRQGIGATIRPTSALSLSANVDVSNNRNDRQWITNEDSGDATRYVFGHIDQKTLSLTLRAAYTITPTLTIQIYGRPFISAGDYTGFKELVDGLNGDENLRYSPYGYQGNPDFRVRSFRMTNVLRWEYRPGSALFVVLQQGRQDSANAGDLSYGRDLGGAFRAPAENTVLVKFSRWVDF
jgi:hypothetical protein